MDTSRYLPTREVMTMERSSKNNSAREKVDWGNGDRGNGDRENDLWAPDTVKLHNVKKREEQFYSSYYNRK